MAYATLLDAQGITAALTAEVFPAVTGLGSPTAATLQATFTNQGGGTSVTAYVQTSIDGGSNYFDIACFHFTATGNVIATVDGRKSITAPANLTDGSLADNTVQEGFLGAQFRVKVTSVGTFTAGTQLTVKLATKDG